MTFCIRTRSIRPVLRSKRDLSSARVPTCRSSNAQNVKSFPHFYEESQEEYQVNMNCDIACVRTFPLIFRDLNLSGRGISAEQELIKSQECQDHVFVYVLGMLQPSPACGASAP